MSLVREDGSPRRWTQPLLAIADLRVQQPLAALALTAIIAIATIFFVRYWSFGSGPVNPFGGYEEQFIEYRFAKNFADKGFLSLDLLPDASTPTHLDGRPLVYTHFPPLASIAGGLLIKLGIASLPSLRLVMMAISLAGLAAIGAFFWQQAGGWQATGVVAVVAFTAAVIQWSNHLVYAYWFGLSFLAFWALSGNPGRRRLWIGLAAIVAVSLISYVQLVVTLATLVALFAARTRGLRVRTVIFAFLVAGGGVALHVLQNVIALGPSVATHDAVYTVSNRILGTPSRAELADFARTHDIVLWGASTPSSVIESARWYVQSLLNHWPILLISYGTLTLLAWQGDRTARHSLRLSAAFTVSGIAWHVIFPAHGHLYPLPFMAALGIAVPVGLTFGLALDRICSHDRIQDLEDWLADHFWDSAATVLIAVGAIALSVHLVDRWYVRNGGDGDALRSVSLWIVVPLALASLLLLVDVLRAAGRAVTAGAIEIAGLTRFFRSGDVRARLAVAISAIACTAFIGTMAFDSFQPKTRALGVAELSLLSGIEGNRVWTNITPQPVSYYTDGPVIGQMPLDALEQLRPEDALVSGVSRNSTDWDWASAPDLFFLSRNGINVAISMSPEESYLAFRKYLSDHYPIVGASTSGALIFDLKRPYSDQTSIRGVSSGDTPGGVKVPLERGVWKSSSQQGPAAASAVVGAQAGTFWHRAVNALGRPLEVPAWIQVQLPSASPIDLLRVHPRQDQPAQSWQFGAVLAGSDDGQSWTDLRNLIPPSPVTADWVDFPVHLDTPYRYYRITLWDTDALSIGKIEAYGSTDGAR